MTYTLKKQIRTDTPFVGSGIAKTQVHAHSTGNSSSTAQNEADYMNRKDLNSGFYTHVVGNGIVIQVAEVNRGAWDVGGYWNNLTYAAVELIESHKTKAEFERDYAIYCELLRDLAKQAGVPVAIDETAVNGIKTHSYCAKNQPNNKSDHIDPLPYLTKWGISLAQFRKDVANAETNNNNTNNNDKTLEDEDMFLLRTKEDGKCYLVTSNEIIHIQTTGRWENLKKFLTLKEIDKTQPAESLTLALKQKK